MSDSSQPHGLQPTRLLYPWDFPARVLEWGAIAFSACSYSPDHLLPKLQSLVEISVCRHMLSPSLSLSIDFLLPKSSTARFIPGEIPLSSKPKLEAVLI